MSLRSTASEPLRFDRQNQPAQYIKISLRHTSYHNGSRKPLKMLNCRFSSSEKCSTLLFLYWF